MESEPRDRYRRLVELSPDGILISQDNRLVFLNPAAVRLFGASAPEQIVGKSPFDVFHPESHGVIRERIRRMISVVRIDGTHERTAGAGTFSTTRAPFRTASVGLP